MSQDIKYESSHATGKIAGLRMQAENLKQNGNDMLAAIGILGVSKGEMADAIREQLKEEQKIMDKTAEFYFVLLDMLEETLGALVDAETHYAVEHTTKEVR